MAAEFSLHFAILFVLIVCCSSSPVPDPHHHDHHDYQQPVVVAAVPYQRPQASVLVPVRTVPVVPIRQAVIVTPVQYGYGG